VIAQKLKLVGVGRRFAAKTAPAPAPGVFLLAWVAVAFAHRDRRRHKQPLSPDNGRGGAIAGQRDFPLHVLHFAPFYHRVGVVRRSVVMRPAPLRPRGGRGWRGGGETG